MAMKRRTIANPRLNLVQHRLAFEHAMKILPATNLRKNIGNPIRFEAELETEEECTAKLVVTNILGFRFTIEPAIDRKNWQAKGDKLAIHKPHRLLQVRLKHYRTALHDWQNTTPYPLTFRHFNLLLAAISYDVEANL